MKLIITTAIAAALLSACAANPEPAPIATPATEEGKAFLDEYLKKGPLIGTAQQQPPGTWQDLMLPPGTLIIGPGAASTTGQVLAPNAVDHG